MKKSFVYFLAVAVTSLCLGLAAQDKMASSTGSKGGTGKKASTGKKAGTGKKGGTGSTGKM